MTTIEELKRERDKLRSQRAVREAMKERDQERKKLKAEIRREKNPNLYRAGASFIKTAKKARRYATVKSVKYIAKKAKTLKRTPIRQARLKMKAPKNNVNEILYGRF